MQTVKQLIMVLGMHRSGTSAIARALEVVGVDLGNDLLPPMANVNEKGFWEDRDFNRLNVDIHAALGKEWYDRLRISASDLELLHRKGYFLRAVDILRKKLEGVSAFGIKDPRATRLLPFWKAVAAHCGYELSFVVAARNPLNVARSLGERDKFDVERGYLLWLDYVLQGLTDSQGSRRLVVDYDRLLDSPGTEIARMADKLGLELDPARLDLYMREFLEQGLRHNECGQGDLALDPRCPEMIREIHEVLIDAATDIVQLDDSAVLERVTKWTTEYARLDPLCGYIHDLTEQVALGLRSLAERDVVIAELRQAEFAQGDRISSLNDGVVRREQQIATLTQQIATLTEEVSARDVCHRAELAALTAKVVACDDEIVRLGGELTTRDEQITALERSVADRNYRISALATSVRQYAESSSWRVSAPIRFVGRNVRRARHLSAAMPAVLERGGGILGTARKSIAVLRREGIHGVRWRLRTLRATGGRTPIEAEPAGVAAMSDTGTYAEWVRLYDSLVDEDRTKIRGQVASMPIRPRISVVMPVYNPPPLFLDKAIWSVRNQLYPDWELCIADDKSTDEAVLELLRRHA